ncbi:ABC transporter permease [Microbacterium gorillae]|uniref:ABC transporter permease n=1 Tax=Microbacterium gorillae TaxID=1231063 RepID=UPI00058FF604|nr:ABC transporter permease [Microbacterium gorillae]
MSLANATRSEVTKQFTTSGWWVLLIVLAAYMTFQAGVLGAAFVFGGTGGAGGERTPLPTEGLAPYVYSISGTAGYVFPLLFGTLMVTTEFRHKLLTPTFLATPRRGQALAAKLLVAVLMGAMFAVVSVIVTVGVGALLFSIKDRPTELDQAATWALIGRSVLAQVLWALIGVGVGSIIRNQVAAIVVVLAFTQFVEPLLSVGAMFVKNLSEPLNYLPGGATSSLIGYSLLSVTGAGGTLLAWWAGALVLAGYAVVLTIIGGLTTWRRDVS